MRNRTFLHIGLLLTLLAGCGGSDRSEPEQAGGPDTGAAIGSGELLDGRIVPDAPAVESPILATVPPVGGGPDAANPDPAPAGTGGGTAVPTGSTGSGTPQGPAPTPSAPSAPGTPPTSGGISTPSSQTPGAASDAAEILARAERTYEQVRSMEADFTQQVHVPLLQTTTHGRGKLYHRSPDRFAMRFSEPAGDLIVVDGRYGWMYYPSTDEIMVMRCPVSQGGQQVDLQREFLSDASRRYTATLTGTETVGGRPAHALTLIPRGSSPYARIRIWVDTQDFLVRRFEITEENESVRRVEMTNVRTNVGLSDDLFRFTPPPNTQPFDC